MWEVVHYDWWSLHMMTSSNGNIFRVTGPSCGEFTGPGEFPAQRPVTQSFDVFYDLRPNKQLSKQPWGWWFETLSWSLWRHCNEKNFRGSLFSRMESSTWFYGTPLLEIRRRLRIGDADSTPSTNLQPHENSIRELAKCSETPTCILHDRRTSRTLPGGGNISYVLLVY